MSEEYVQEHETEVAAHSEFSNYLKRYNLFENMFDFIENPNNILEKEYISEQSKEAKDYINKCHRIDITDKSIEGYVFIVFQAIKKFYQAKLTDGESYIIFALTQYSSKVKLKWNFIKTMFSKYKEKLNC